MKEAYTNFTPLPSPPLKGEGAGEIHFSIESVYPVRTGRLSGQSVFVDAGVRAYLVGTTRLWRPLVAC